MQFLCDGIAWLAGLDLHMQEAGLHTMRLTIISYTRISNPTNSVQICRKRFWNTQAFRTQVVIGFLFKMETTAWEKYWFWGIMLGNQTLSGHVIAQSMKLKMQIPWTWPLPHDGAHIRQNSVWSAPHQLTPSCMVHNCCCFCTEALWLNPGWFWPFKKWNIYYWTSSYSWKC